LYSWAVFCPPWISPSESLCALSSPFLVYPCFFLLFRFFTFQTTSYAEIFLLFFSSLKLHAKSAYS
jgi:hypothetical protein